MRLYISCRGGRRHTGVGCRGCLGNEAETLPADSILKTDGRSDFASRQALSQRTGGTKSFKKKDIIFIYSVFFFILGGFGEMTRRMCNCLPEFISFRHLARIINAGDNAN